MKHDKFWMVWNPIGHTPTRKHRSREDANREATRLAKKNPRQNFFVLKAVGGFATEDTPVIPIKMTTAKDNTPF
ncbi:conserved hypothetical protein [Roseibium sp. TrichSKD4]|uniref:hypothetical protein n=1 Tax=Roseibium sp. TrichSKD4 TaxID=744980 RepID=UPI0001E56657|nr:hypothetical protein [Roseibium sp. TrichSKD4]EFO33569.1 conserved hypothetical protein [Roseibium sp. TrichSKD4]